MGKSCLFEGVFFDFGVNMKVGRNDPCLCGSGKKYKHCCKERIEAIERLEFARKGSLYLPRSPIVEKPADSRLKELDYITVYLTLKELVNKTSSIEELQDILKGLNKKDGLCFFSLMNMIVANDGFANLTLQVELIKLFFPADIINKIASYQKNKKIIVFTELQITNIIKLMCIFGNNNDGETIDKIEKSTRLSDIFLLMNDLMTEQNETEAQKSHTRKEIINSMLKTMLTSHLYANHEKIAFAMPRYYIMYFDIARSAEIKGHKLYCDLHAIFNKATGLNLEDYFTLLIGIHAQFLAQSIIKKSVDFKRITISRRKYFKDTMIAEDQKEKIFNTLVIVEPDLRNILEQELKKGSVFYLNNSVLMLKPLVQIDDDQLICSNLSFLLSKITSGIFWTLFDYVKSKGEDPESISRFFGILFERYVQMLFDRIRGTSASYGSMNTVYLPKKYKGRQNTQEESTDIILEYPEVLIFIEVVSSRLKLKDTIILGDIDSFWDDLDKIVIDKAKQLERKIQDYKNDLFYVGGRKYSESKIKGFYAIIIGLEGFPYWTAVREELDVKLAAGDLLQPKNGIKGWDFIDVEELEYLESVLETESLLNLLEKKLSDPVLKNMAIKNFLHRENLLNADNEFLALNRDRIFKQAQKHLFGNKEADSH